MPSEGPMQAMLSVKTSRVPPPWSSNSTVATEAEWAERRRQWQSQHAADLARQRARAAEVERQSAARERDPRWQDEHQERMERWRATNPAVQRHYEATKAKATKDKGG